MLFFTDSKKSLKLDGDPLKTMTNYKFNVDRSNSQDRKGIYEFGNEMNFNIRQMGRKSNRDTSLAKLLKSPAIRASGILTIILPENPNDLFYRLKTFLQEK